MRDMYRYLPILSGVNYLNYWSLISRLKEDSNIRNKLTSAGLDKSPGSPMTLVVYLSVQVTRLWSHSGLLDLIKIPDLLLNDWSRKTRKQCGLKSE